DDGSPALRAGLLDALRAIDRAPRGASPPDVLPDRSRLRSLLDEKDDDLRTAAFRALDQSLARAREQATLEDLEAVQRAIASGSPDLRVVALDFVWRMDVMRPATLAADVERLWDDGDGRVRWAAIAALARLEPEHALAMALARLKDADATRRK